MLDYVGIALLMMILAPELILPFAGFLVAKGELSFTGVLAVATFGALAGQLGIYGVARVLGERRIRYFLRQYGYWILLEERDLDRVFRMLARHTSAVLISGRFMPAIRSVVSLPAGFMHMPLLKFSGLTLIGTGLWNAMLLGLGVLLGANWQALEPILNAYEWLGVALVALVMSALIRRRVKHVLELRSSS